MLAMGEVNAAGLEATSLLTLCKTGLSTMVSNLVFRPQEIAQRLNRTVHETSSSGAVMGYLCGVYDLGQGWLTLINAGHTYPYILRPDTGDLSQVDRDSGPPLGTDPNAEYTDFDLQMAPGDCLIAYSPALVELRNPAGEAYGLARLEDAIRRHGKLEPEPMKDAMLEELMAFRGRSADEPLEDDVALLVVRFERVPVAAA
jgi:sigma-B regulation protein RsbU (phosphoserine phosphatase)